jgi:(p)ppGpp synthase/HD superfamily hydrolase
MNIQDAVAIVAEAHKEQFRKGIFKHVPYLQHLFDVLKRVFHYLLTGEDKLNRTVLEMQIAALFHDLIEDTSMTYDDIVRLAGKDIADLVMEMTREDDLGNTRKDKFEWLVAFKDKSLESIIIKIADRYSNVMDYMADEKKQAYASFYALQAYPLFQYYLEYGGENVRILNDIREMDLIVQRRYHISLFERNKMQEVAAIVTTPGLHGWKS